MLALGAIKPTRQGWHQLFALAEKSPLAERLVDSRSRITRLLSPGGFTLSFAASPPVAERVGLPPWHFILRHAAFCVVAFAVWNLDTHASAGSDRGADRADR